MGMHRELVVGLGSVWVTHGACRVPVGHLMGFIGKGTQWFTGRPPGAPASSPHSPGYAVHSVFYGGEKEMCFFGGILYNWGS